MNNRLRKLLRTSSTLALAVVPVAFAGCDNDIFTPDTTGGEALTAPSTSVAASQAGPASSSVYTFPGGPDQMLIEGASAHMVRTGNGVNFRVNTNSLLPGHAYTLWVVIFNNPDQCSTAPCNPLDLFNPDAKPDMLYGAGTVVGGAGRATLAGRTKVGDVSGSVQAPVGLLSNGLIDPFGAEFHLVVHHHGPVIPEFMPDMIQSLAGGCTDAGIPAQGATSPWNDYALSPEYGGEFGRLGPNACSSVQFSILSP